jgi:hypothetical protein
VIVNVLGRYVTGDVIELMRSPQDREAVTVRSRTSG